MKLKYCFLTHRYYKYELLPQLLLLAHLLTHVEVKELSSIMFKFGHRTRYVSRFWKISNVCVRTCKAKITPS